MMLVANRIHQFQTELVVHIWDIVALIKAAGRYVNLVG